MVGTKIVEDNEVICANNFDFQMTFQGYLKVKRVKTPILTPDSKRAENFTFEMIFYNLL